MSEAISSKYLMNKRVGQCCHFNLDQNSHFVYLTGFFINVSNNSILLSNRLHIFINLTEQCRGLKKMLVHSKMGYSSPKTSFIC